MDEKDKKSGELFRKGEEFQQLQRKVESFTREIISDNEKLRYRVSALEQENKSLKLAGADDGRDGDDLVAKIRRLEREKEEILKEYKEVEQENIDFARRYVEIEEENNNLANLYVASYQLHSTLDLKEVLRIVKEIIINLIGADRFAVYLVDQNSGEMSSVAAEGLEMDALPAVRLGSGIVGRNLTENAGKVYVSESRSVEAHSVEDPLVSIPLRIKDDPFGSIVILGLLQQKKEFTPLDIELFHLLGGHAATAIFASKLYSESKRKLTTIQGFLNLLKPGVEDG
jgi:nitrate/nitrite-specific signal transduction histidine kinase